MRRIGLKFFFPFIVGLIIVGTYQPILKGEFIFDDIQAVWSNADLISVTSPSKIFTFTLKPTRTLSNILLALGEFLAPRKVVAQRAISVFLHIAVTLLLFLNLSLLGQVYKKWLTQSVVWGITLLFAVSPIHSESIVVAQYRMDMLGTFFSFLSVWIVQREASCQNDEVLGKSQKTIYKILLFLFLGAATLSKEPYALIAPVLCLVVAGAYGQGRRVFFELVLFQSVWATLLISKMIQAQKYYPYAYSEFLGYQNLSPLQHFHLAMEAFFEGIYKIFTGHNLTIVRIYERSGLLGPNRMAWGIAIWALLSSFLVLLLRKPNYWRVASTFFLVGGYLYLLIPNINIGSEHYWYFGVAGFWMLLVPVAAKAMRRVTPQRAQVWFVLTLIGLSAAQVSNLRKRLDKMAGRFDFYLSELNTYPRNANRWVDLAATLIDQPRSEIWPLARPMLFEAKEIDPTNPLVVLNEFVLAGKLKERSEAAGHYRRLMALYESRPDQKALFREYWRAVFGGEPGTHAMK